MELFLKISGLVILMSGVILGYLDITGVLISKEKEAFLAWVLTSRTGLPIADPAAKIFMKDYSPPKSSQLQEITHVTKNTVTVVGSKVLLNAGINYMYANGERTAVVASLEEIREWESKTIYPVIAWVLSLIGLIEMVVSFAIERYKIKTEKRR